MEFNYERKYITTDGKEHKEIQKKEKERRYKMPHLAFGELCLDSELRKKINEDIWKIEDDEEKWDYVYRINEMDTLGEIRKHISSMDPEDDFVENFIFEASENPKVEGYVPFNLPYFAEWMVKNSLNNEIISNSLLKEMLKFHVEEYKKEAEIFDQKVKIIKADFLKCLVELIKDGVLPSSIDVDEMTVRINDIDVRLEENLYSRDRHLASATEFGVSLNWDYRNRDDDEIKRLLFHELIHISAGRIIRKTQQSEKEEGNYFAYQKRSGFHINFSAERVWLNEGVTEMITKIFAKHAKLKESIFEPYKYEQKIIEELIQKGVPREYFIEAFFEDYNEEIKGMPKWKRLIKKIHEVDQGGFLRMIKEKTEKRRIEAEKEYEEYLNG